MLSIRVLVLLAGYEGLRFSSREEPLVPGLSGFWGFRKISGGFLEAFAVDCGCSSGLLGIRCTKQLLQRSWKRADAGHRFYFSRQHHGR
jgi:hypothetical protein